MKIKYLNLCLVLCLVAGSLLSAYPTRAQATEWPPTDFWNEPQIPSIFDKVAFGLYDYPPYDWQCTWDFGDGTTANECWINSSKQYNADGDYTVNLHVFDPDGGQPPADYSITITVSTHDVAITKFIVPQSTRAGQTR
jgi:hypothetical protein